MQLPISAIIEHLSAAYSAALKDIAASKKLTTEAKERWTTATRKAYAWLVKQDSVSYNAATYELTMVSPDSGSVYRANGVCGCAAFAKHNACYHRAAARLVRRSLERVAYLADAETVATAIEALEDQGHSYDSADLGARLAAKRRERVYSDVQELFT